jgi:L-arginine dehydrogenase
MIENIKLYNEQTVLNSIDRSQVISVLKKAFKGLADGSTVQPGQTLAVMPKQAGDCIFYPGIIHDLDLIGVKLSPYIQARSDLGESPVSAYTLLMSATTGKPTLLCDSLALTTLRTAATSALALEYLTPNHAKKLCLIGSGSVAKEHLAFVEKQRDWQEISVWSPSLSENPDKLSDLQSASSKALSMADSAEEAVRDADVVMLCTSSAVAVIQAQWLKEDAVVTSISTNAVNAHEVAPEQLKLFSVFCDYKKTAPSTAGEMILAIESGDWREKDIVGDLNDLITGALKRPDSGKVFFRSTGLGLEDLAIASLLM